LIVLKNKDIIQASLGSLRIKGLIRSVRLVGFHLRSKLEVI
jgi:hypothetical protein